MLNTTRSADLTITIHRTFYGRLDTTTAHAPNEPCKARPGYHLKPCKE